MIDKRTKKWKTIQRWFNKGTLASVWLGLLIGTVFTVWLHGKLHPQTSPQPPKQTIEVKAEEYTREYYESDPLRYIRFRGQELGYDDYTISDFIKIARCESGFNLDPNAININNDKHKSMDVGIFQINTYWHRDRVTVKEMLDPVKNIDFAYQLLSEQGFNPWNSSKNKWSK